MQLSKPKYLAIDPERGANLDTIDTPLNDRALAQPGCAAPAGDVEPERVPRSTFLLDHANPGPGGFYDDLGDPGNSPHLVREPSFEDDPFLLRAPFHGFMLKDDGRSPRGPLPRPSTTPRCGCATRGSTRRPSTR